jgi:excisionase family DNA binding protein
MKTNSTHGEATATVALAHSIEGARERASVSRSAIFAAIKSGTLKARKSGRRTLILDHDLKAWLASLPVVEAA